VNHSGVPHEPPRIPVFRQGRTSRLSQQPDPPPWPPQSYVAPFSWMVAREVEQGREALNFSTWDEDDGEADDARRGGVGRRPTINRLRPADSPAGQPRGRKPARKDWSSSREPAQRLAGAWNRMAWRRPAATKVTS
jgi:hypothetical protein